MTAPPTPCPMPARKAGRPSSTRWATSRDGTPIAVECFGRGPALVLVDGALCHRRMGPAMALAEASCDDFTVWLYDRRGRGESLDTVPPAIECEIDDFAAVLAAAGGRAFAWGTSSGAVLALDAVARVGGIERLAVYEAPLIVDASRPATSGDWARIAAAVADGRRGDAVRLFLRCVGVPWIATALMRLMPMWKRLEAVAPTLPYDGALVCDLQRGEPLPAARWRDIGLPVLVMDGGASPSWMRRGNEALAAALPNAAHHRLDGENHMLKARVHAPVLKTFFLSPARGTPHPPAR